MPGQPSFTPDYVYNLIANNPQGRVFVENLAKMSQLQQAAQQFAPQVNQFAQNPMQAMQTIGDWAQGAVNQMSQQPQPQQMAQQQPTNTQPEQPQQGGAPMQGGMMGMAMEVIGEFKNSLKEMSEILTTIKKDNDELSVAVAVLSENNKTLLSDLAAAKQDTAAMRKDLAKLTSAKG